MGLAVSHNIPEKPLEKTEWTFRKLFSPTAVTALAKVFVNPFEVLLGFLVFVVATGELLEREFSLGFWVIVGAVLIVTAAERFQDRQIKAHVDSLKKK